jgi:hypothetical protein
MGGQMSNVKGEQMSNVNWLGDEFEVGDWVFRGARDGNSSSFKVGQVVKVDDKGVRIHWKYEPAHVWTTKHTSSIRAVSRLDNYGRPDVNSLVKLRSTIELRLEAQARALDTLSSIPLEQRMEMTIEDIRMLFNNVR